MGTEEVKFNSFKLYGLAGYTNTKIEINGLGQLNDSEGNITGNYPYKHTESESGFSYGAGLGYQINAQFNVFIDYQVLPDFEPNSNFSKSWESTTIGVNYTIINGDHIQIGHYMIKQYNDYNDN